MTTEMVVPEVRDLTIDYGRVSSPVAAGGNALTDTTKAWGRGGSITAVNTSIVRIKLKEVIIGRSTHCNSGQ